MANTIFNKGITERANGNIDLLTDDIQVMLVTGYTPNPDDDFVADVTSSGTELSGTGYSRQSLASKSVSEDDTGDQAIFDCADVSYSGISTTNDIACLIFFNNTGSDSTSQLLWAIDTATGLPKATNGSDITLGISNLITMQQA